MHGNNPSRNPLVSNKTGCFCCRDFQRLADESEATTLRHVPLEDLHADAAAWLREFDHVVILAMLRDDRRAWQAWVRLTKVFRLEHVGILVR